jgi:cytochrome c biogenesis protein CcmG/thiol:disulfide interchange protein DsbE
LLPRASLRFDASVIRVFLWFFCALFLLSAPARAIEPGVEAPAFRLPDAAGDTLALADYAGAVVYIDFWASWCGPCLISFPVMERLQQQYAEQGFTVLAINVDQRRQDADAFLRKRSVGFPVLFDSQGSTPAAFGIKGMPTSYLVDGDGKVIHVHEGFKRSDGARIEKAVRAALGLAVEAAD